MTFASFKNARIVRSSWLEEGGRRLDCNPYMSGALEARDALRALACRKDRLGDLTLSMFDSGRESRSWVSDIRYGVPYMGSSSINLADLSTLPLISKRQIARNPKLLIEEGWSLITRSGTIGRMAYVRPDMAGLACSEDVLRIVPNESRISAGYLNAFLSSSFGVPLVVAGTYGAIIQHIEPHHLENIEVPRFDSLVEHEISDGVARAAKARAEAFRLKKVGVARLLERLVLPDISGLPTSQSFSVGSANCSELTRLDATYFSPHGRLASDALADARNNPRQLMSCARVFTPGIFKRLYVQDPQWGFPYYSGSELFELAPTARGYLSKRAPNIDDYLIEKDWLLVQDAGQVGGLIGRVTRAEQSVHQSVVSNHLMRIAPENREDAAFIFAVLSSPYGYRAIVRNSFGSSIPQLDPKHVGAMHIPWLDVQARQYVSEPILKSWDLMDLADWTESRATALVEQQIRGEGA